MGKLFTVSCIYCDFSRKANTEDKVMGFVEDHLDEHPDHDLDVKVNGFSFLVMCEDCGYHDIEPTKDLAEDNKAEHRIGHYGHSVRVKRIGKDNKNGIDVKTYNSRKKVDPHAFHNKFAKRVIHKNMDSDDIQSLREKVVQ
jgi:hypothetical protein